LTVANSKTGELVIEKKFYKADFDKIMSDPEYAGYIETLLKHALVKKMTSEFDLEIDHESYEEVRSIALDMEEELGDFKP
jgi:tRNA U34 5-carboxymethylaminomethyl modifying enzyme MnmG/GidA